MVSSGVAALSSSRLRSVQKLGTPVVGVDYVSQCLDQGVLLPLDGFRLEVPPTGSSYPPPQRVPPPPRPAPLSAEKGTVSCPGAFSVGQLSSGLPSVCDVCNVFEIYTS